jgi:hypothetical protein
VSYELREAVRLAEVAIHGSPWTGKLEKHEVERAVRRLIAVAESIARENERLKTDLTRRRSR